MRTLLSDSDGDQTESICAADAREGCACYVNRRGPRKICSSERTKGSAVWTIVQVCGINNDAGARCMLRRECYCR